MLSEMVSSLPQEDQDKFHIKKIRGRTRSTDADDEGRFWTPTGRGADATRFNLVWDRCAHWLECAQDRHAWRRYIRTYLASKYSL